MKQTHKQWISGIAVNLLFIPALISFAMFAEGYIHGWIPLVLFSVFLMSPVVLKKIFGPDAFYLQWKEEGFQDKRQWIQESDSAAAKIIRKYRSNWWKHWLGTALFIAVILIIKKLIEPVN